MRKLNVSLLSATEADYAFPLIRTVWPKVELDGWRHFAQLRIAAGSQHGNGILAVRNEQDCIVGIAAFQLFHDMLHGRVLFADPFCALDIVDEASVARALENGLEKIARRHDCTAVHTIVASGSGTDDDDWLFSALYERGHRVEGLHMCKLIPAVT